MASPTDEGLSLFDAAQLLHNVPYSGTTWQDLNTRTASRVTHIIYHLFDFDAWEVWKVEPKPPPPAEPSISSCGDSVKVAPACDLIAFHSRLDLVVRSKDGSGAEIVKPVDFQLVRASSSQHQLALRLCAQVATSMSLEWCYDIKDDSLLDNIRNLNLNTAVAVPVVAGGRVTNVIVFLSTRLEQASPLLLRILEDASVALARASSWQLSHPLASCAPLPFLHYSCSDARPGIPTFDTWVKLACEALGCAAGEMWQCVSSGEGLAPAAHLSSVFSCESSSTEDATAEACLLHAAEPTSPSHALWQAVTLSGKQVWQSASSFVQTAGHIACFGRHRLAAAVPVFLCPLSSSPLGPTEPHTFSLRAEDDAASASGPCAAEPPLSPPQLLSVFVFYWPESSEVNIGTPPPPDCVDFLARIAGAAAASHDLISNSGTHRLHPSIPDPDSSAMHSGGGNPSLELSSRALGERQLFGSWPSLNPSPASNPSGDLLSPSSEDASMKRRKASAVSPRTGSTMTRLGRASLIDTRSGAASRSGGALADGSDEDDTRIGIVRMPANEATFRRGKWTKEEEDYTHMVVECFKSGILPLEDGTTLRNLLSVQLHCVPMRITKKFSKDASIGKQIFKRAGMDHTQWKGKCASAMARLQNLRDQFLMSLTEKDRVLLSPDALGIGMQTTKDGKSSPSTGGKPGRKRSRGVLTEEAKPLPPPQLPSRRSRGQLAMPSSGDVLGVAAFSPPSRSRVNGEDGFGSPSLPSVPSFGPLAAQWQAMHPQDDGDPIASPFAIAWPPSSNNLSSGNLGYPSASPPDVPPRFTPLEERRGSGTLHTSVSEPSLAMIRRHPFGSAESLLELANAPPKPSSPAAPPAPPPSSSVADAAPLTPGHSSRPPFHNSAPSPSASLRHVASESALAGRGSSSGGGGGSGSPTTPAVPAPVPPALPSASDATPGRVTGGLGHGFTARPSSSVPSVSPSGTSSMDLLLLQPMGSFGDFLSPSRSSYTLGPDGQRISTDIADLGPMFDNPGTAQTDDVLAEEHEMI